MKTFKLNVGGDPIIFEAPDASGFLESWGSVNRNWSPDADKWRRAAAQLACDFSGKPMRFDTDSNLAADMMDAGMLEEVKNAQG